jgi:uncharacterized membrane protein
MESMAIIGVLIGGIVGIAILALWIWAVVDIIKSDFKDIVMKIVWLLLVIFIPLLGFILYVIVGKSTKLPRGSVVSAAKYDDLARLKSLYDSGAISEAEFEAEKRKIMD